MKRQIYIQVIKDFILEKPNRTPAEIQDYASEVNATNEELQQAMTDAREILKKEAPSSPKSPLSPKLPLKLKTSLHLPTITLPFHTIPAFAIQAVAVVSLTGVMVLGATSLYLFTRINSISQSLNTTHSSTSGLIQGSNGGNLMSTIAQPVYASGKIPVDANEIFSYPASDITLKYSGLVKRDILGFFPYWMLDEADKINVTGYTDIALFGLTSDGRGNIVTAVNGAADPGWEMWNNPQLDEFINRVKKRNIRVELVIKSFNNGDIESITNSNDNQTRLIANAIQLMNSKSLDGINIDFEYVGGNAKTRDNFTRFIANLNAELKRQNPDALLTVDTYVSSAADAAFFDVTALADSIDAFVVMGYDIHTPSGDAGPVAPLEGGGGLVGYLQSYLERVSPDKIILALPYYGYDWPISPNPNQDTRAQSRILPYAVIAEASKTSKIMWEAASQTPYYKYKDPETGILRVVHFDNSRSLGLKYDFINKGNFRGVGIWALGYDGLNQELHQVLLDKFTG